MGKYDEDIFTKVFHNNVNDSKISNEVYKQMLVKMAGSLFDFSMIFSGD